VDQWHVAIEGRQEGPWPTEEVVRRIRARHIPRTAHVFAQVKSVAVSKRRSIHRVDRRATS